MDGMMPDFEKRNVKVMALSCDTVEDHRGFIKACTFEIDFFSPLGIHQK